MIWEGRIQRVRLDSPYGYATVEDSNGRRHVSNGATGLALSAERSGGIVVALDFPDDGTYPFPPHWLASVDESADR